MFLDGKFILFIPPVILIYFIIDRWIHLKELNSEISPFKNLISDRKSNNKGVIKSEKRESLQFQLFFCMCFFFLLIIGIFVVIALAEFLFR